MPRPRLILIEGLPGSGKTSLAQWLCEHLTFRGVSADWVPELQRDHPIIDRATMRTARLPGYVDRCIERWSAFSARGQALRTGDVLIAEGCLFQSTVRFLIEYERPREEVERYLPGVEAAVGSLRPCLIYLTQPDARAYLEKELVRRKPREYVSRIARYTASTPFATRRGLEGMPALIDLYCQYRSVCDELAHRSTFPLIEIDAVALEESQVQERVGPWVAALLAV